MIKKMDTERFKYCEDSQYIVDKLTGYNYPCNSKELADLLNQLNNRADKNAEFIL